MREFMQVCLQAVQAGGQVLTEMQGRITPREKAPNDVVTEADFVAQATIRKLIKGVFPDHDFVGEEQDEPPRTGAESGTELDPTRYCWVVDPLDGTLNYVHGLPGYAVSVALRQGDRLLVGAVFDPVLGECFTARRGGGAWLNGRPIQPSQCTALSQAVVAVSLPPQPPRGSRELARLTAVLLRAQAIRRLGSAALNLAYVAMGRLDAYYATSVKPWDVAAGALMLQEAGGQLSDVAGGPFILDNPLFAAAATEPLHGELLQALAVATE